MLIKRPDLAKKPWTSPALVGAEVLPSIPVTQNTDDIYFMLADTPTVSGPTSGRANTDALGVNDNALGSITYALVSKEYRAFRSSRGILPQMEEKTKEELAIVGKNRVAFLIEKARADLLYDAGTPVTSVSDSAFVKNIKTAVRSVRSKGSPAVVIMSSTTFDTICEMSAFTSSIGKNITAATGNPNAQPEDYAAIQMAAVFGCRKVLVGQNTAWDAGQTNAASVVVCALPNPALDPTAEPKLGGVLVKQEFFEDELTPFTCEEGYDDNRKGPFVDTSAFIDPKLMNEVLAVVVKLPAEASV